MEVYIISRFSEIIISKYIFILNVEFTGNHKQLLVV